MDEPNIVAAVGTAVGFQGEQTTLDKLLEAAQVEAIKLALAEGVSIEDGPELLKRKAAARQAVLDAQ